MSYTTFGILCIWTLLGACSMPRENETNQDHLSPADLLHLSPAITALENLPDSLQPQRVMLRNTPIPKSIKIPIHDHEAYEFVDYENNTRKIIPPGITQRPTLQDEMGQPVFDQDGNYYFLGEGGFPHLLTYTTDNGLALDNITSSLLDASGNLWFGTWGGGISKFDGMSFTNFNTAHGLSNNLVHCLAQDAEGNIWIGTDGGGVSIYDGYAFSHITTLEGLANDIVYGLTADSKGNMWIATKGGASKYDGTSFSNYDRENGLPGNSIIKIAEDNKGQIWFASGNNGVSSYNGSSFTHFTTEDGLADNAVNSITMDSSGNIWFGTRGGGVSKYHEKSESGGNGFFTNFTIADGLGHHEIWKIIEDREGNLWFATGGGGVSKYDGKQFSNFTTSQGLPVNMVYTIIEDRSGNIWVGTAGGGVTLFLGTAFRIFTKQQGLGANSVYGITEDNAGNLWFGTNGGGVSKYDGKAFTNFTYDQGLAHPLVISSFKDSNGRLWFGTGGGGVSLYQESSDGSRNATFTTYNSHNGLQNDVIYAIIEDGVGNLWFGTGGGGLVKFDGNIMPEGQGSFTAFKTAQGLAGNTVYSLFEDSKGNVWIGTAGGGVSKFDGKSFTNYTTEHGLSNDIVWSILEDMTGALWFATQGGGVSRFDGTTFSSFTTREGLADDTAFDLLEDNEGNIFIGTNLGFTVIPKHIVHFPVSELQPYLEYYNTAFGYPVRDINKGIFLDSQGTIWAGSGSYKTALVNFDYQALAKKKLKPTAKIKNISINDKAISWSSLLSTEIRIGESDYANSYVVDEIRTLGKLLSGSERQSLQEEMKSVKFSGISRFENFPEKLVLQYVHNNITIDFGTDELARAHLIEYTYILEGYSKNWSPTTNKTTATFGNIREGDYTFKVAARYTGPSEEGAKVWSDSAVYSFTVLPPWYRSWWAYLIYVFLLLALIRWIHQFQKARTLRKERERTQQKELEQAKEIEKAYAELKSTQAQLIHAEKMASLGELTAGIAHEIQNPLNFVNNFSEISSELVEEIKGERIKDKGERDEALEDEILNDISQNLEKINHHGKRAADIVKGMLQHSRTSSGVKEPTDINALADEYLRLAYHGLRAKDKSFNADFKTEFDPNLPKINVIPQDIGRVLLNLINNAFYAVNARKTTTVETRHALSLPQTTSPYKPTVTVSTKNLGDRIEISVKDNGNGIPDSIKDKIFQPFFTTKPTGQGTGLGLSLSYDIVKAHGGELRVETNEARPSTRAGTDRDDPGGRGEGTEFKILLSTN
jgi:signal transduction histidine kinase/ligand-binding sensor domain-containing protein